MTEPTPAASERVALIVLAAGAGTRMRSDVPKPLHPVAGTPMLWHVLRAGAAAAPVTTVVVLSPAIAGHPAWQAAEFPVHVAIQDPPLGTAHAAATALPRIGDVDKLVVLFADHPLLTGATVERLMAGARESGAPVTVLTCVVEDAAGYARIERDERGRVRRIVERKDDDPAKRGGKIEINSGMMVLDAGWARATLPEIAPSPVTGEYYLPELVRLAAESGSGDGPWPVSTVQGAPEDLLGVNDRVEQAHADRVLRERVRRMHMLNGVSLVLPETIVIDDDVAIGADTTILPYSMLLSGTRIGGRCRIGPHAVIERSAIADGVTVRASTIVDSTMEADADAGPYAHLRGGARIGAGAHIGTSAEIKNSAIGAGSLIGHFSYVGDATLGERVNIGAGTITCNFNGVTKNQTTIGEGAFIGSDTLLVAPVEIGAGAVTGAGAVVTKNVPPAATAVGVPARVIKRREPDGGAGGEGNP